MRIASFLLIALLLAGNGIRATAATAYKCIGAHGAITFQDRPCRSGEKQQAIHVPDSPPPGQIPAEAPPPEVPVAAAPVPEPPPQPQAPQIPPPEFYLCLRGDGSVYMSDTGEGGSMMMPLGVLGIPNRNLTDARPGTGVMGVSAPGLSPTPHIPAAAAGWGGGYTWVYDECHFATPREACTYLRTQLDDVTSKLRRAFSDTTPQLKQQQSQLRERMRGC